MDITYLRNHINNLPDYLLERAIAIYLYGSVARNDSDEDSDCDILVCTEDCSEDEFLLLKDLAKRWERKYNYEFSFYPISTLKEMKKKGSYFLWHIKKEGILLYKQHCEIESLLADLPLYEGTHDDFLEYSEILDDITLSISQDNTTFEYELSILAVLARNICIGCCYLIGDMDFGRLTPIKKCIDYWDNSFPFSLSDYHELYEFRLLYTRGKKINHDIVSFEYVKTWLDKIRSCLLLALSLVR